MADRTDKRKQFLAELSQTGNVSLAVAAARIARSSVYAWREQDAAFAAAWDAAKRQGEEAMTETLEAEILRRALAKSDTLLIFEAKARKPQKYAEAKGHSESAPCAPELNDTQLAARVSRIFHTRTEEDEPA